MNYYETLYIIHPALDGGRIKEMVLSVNKILEKHGGASSFVDIWGKKKLAYEIDKQKYGTYILVQFTGDGLGNAKFNMELEHNPNILAYLTTRIDDEKLREQKVSLEEQITGDSPPHSSKAKVENSSDKKVEIVENNSKETSASTSKPEENNDKPSKESKEAIDESEDQAVVEEDNSEDQAVVEEDNSEDQAVVEENDKQDESDKSTKEEE